MWSELTTRYLSSARVARAPRWAHLSTAWLGYLADGCRVIHIRRALLQSHAYVPCKYNLYPSSMCPLVPFFLAVCMHVCVNGCYSVPILLKTSVFRSTAMTRVHSYLWRVRDYMFWAPCLASNVNPSLTSNAILALPLRVPVYTRLVQSVRVCFVQNNIPRKGQSMALEP